MYMERKVVLVTGSSRGIGKGIIIEFAKLGYDVVINYNHSFSDAYVLKELVEKEYNVKTLVVQCDVSNENEVVDMVKDVINEFGHIDVLVNNAAIEECSEFKDKDKKKIMEEYKECR